MAFMFFTLSQVIKRLYWDYKVSSAVSSQKIQLRRASIAGALIFFNHSYGLISCSKKRHFEISWSFERNSFPAGYFLSTFWKSRCGEKKQNCCDIKNFSRGRLCVGKSVCIVSVSVSVSVSLSLSLFLCFSIHILYLFSLYLPSSLSTIVFLFFLFVLFYLFLFLLSVLPLSVLPLSVFSFTLSCLHHSGYY